MRRLWAIAIVLWLGPAIASAEPQRTVIVRMFSPVEIPAGAGAARLKALARPAQQSLDALLRAPLADGRVSRVIPLWIIHGAAVTATADVIDALEGRAEVASITADQIAVIPTDAPIGPNVGAVGAPQLWAAGLRGQGKVVASLDTGVDVGHPELGIRWRGGANSWFDPYNQHPAPSDAMGHGTWTMGVMVGGDAGGTSLGIAPDAKWIAAKIFNDQGVATASAIHQAFQWVLDPDGDPATADAPDVVNNSWGFGAPGCLLEFQADLQALRAAGIVAVFSAGNGGPGVLTSSSPANYPNAFSVGSVDGTGAIAFDSSRGPSACDGSVFPDVVAPGVGIATTDLFAGYTSVSGTSIAAPAVSGIFVLLREAFPSATVAQLEAAVMGSAVDLGLPGADNAFGHGRVDALAARALLQALPSAAGDFFAITEDTGASFSSPGVLANDSAGGLTAVLVSTVAHGALSLQPNGGFSYMPFPDFNGTDGFTYVANDGVRSSSAAQVTLTVSAVNDAPVAVDDRVTLARRAPIAIDVTANDLDVDSAIDRSTVRIVTGPAKGTAIVSANGLVVYSPGRTFAGRDVFTYRISDDHGARSRAATVRVEKP